MSFDYEGFSEIVESVYYGGPYTLKETQMVFWWYFANYYRHTGQPHPRIRKAQIRRICMIMPWLGAEGMGGSVADIEPDDYRYIIHQHFRTKYRNCDYNINHFFSGRVRELRWYETCY